MMMEDLLNQREQREFKQTLRDIADGLKNPVAPKNHKVEVTNQHRGVLVLNPVETVRVANPVTEVTVKNPVNEVAVTNLNEVIKTLSLLGVGIKGLNDAVERIKLDVPEKEIQKIAGAVTTDVDLSGVEERLERAVDEVSRVVAAVADLDLDVSIPEVKIPEFPTAIAVNNLKEVTDGLKALNDNIVALSEQMTAEEPDDDDADELAPVISGLASVREAIRNIVFPIPPGSTPAFKNQDGVAASATLNDLGYVPVAIQESQIASQTATVSSVSGSASSVTLLSANVDRLAAEIYNDSTAILYVKLGTTASASDFTSKIFPEGTYVVPQVYTGRVDGIWASATGAARITEVGETD